MTETPPSEFYKYIIGLSWYISSVWVLRKKLETFIHRFNVLKQQIIENRLGTNTFRCDPSNIYVSRTAENSVREIIYKHQSSRFTLLLNIIQVLYIGRRHVVHVVYIQEFDIINILQLLIDCLTLRYI